MIIVMSVFTSLFVAIKNTIRELRTVSPVGFKNIKEVKASQPATNYPLNSGGLKHSQTEDSPGNSKYALKNKELADSSNAEAGNNVAVLVRCFYTDLQIVGSLGLYNDDVLIKVVDTLELAYRNNEVSESAIKKGDYTCKLTYSKSFDRWLYEVLNVEGRSGIRFHEGNFYYDVEGCILVGDGFADINKDGVTDILNSLATLDYLHKFFNDEPFKLKIR